MPQQQNDNLQNDTQQDDNSQNDTQGKTLIKMTLRKRHSRLH
jgi:hypothetical protein